MPQEIPPDVITVTIPQFQRISGLGHTKIYDLIHKHNIVTVTIGARRLIVVDSYRQLIAKQLVETPGDARRNSTVLMLGSGKKVNSPLALVPVPEIPPKRKRGRPRKISPIGAST